MYDLAGGELADVHCRSSAVSLPESARVARWWAVIVGRGWQGRHSPGEKRDAARSSRKRPRSRGGRAGFEGGGRAQKSFPGVFVDPDDLCTVHLRALGTVGALFFYVLETVDLETPAPSKLTS